MGLFRPSLEGIGCELVEGALEDDEGRLRISWLGAKRWSTRPPLPTPIFPGSAFGR